jgi:Tol biopolymer transport system component
LYIAPITGAEPESLFLTSAFGKYPTSWSADGKIVFHTKATGSSFDVMVAEAGRAGSARALLDSRFVEAQGHISPDGKWLAYTSNETGQFQVYVRPLSGGTRLTVSDAGGVDPHWRASGDELFYISLKTNRLNAVSIKRTSEQIEIGTSQPLFEIRDATILPPYTSIYDVAPDGEHFLVRVSRDVVRTTPLAVLLNWPANRRR